MYRITIDPGHGGKDRANVGQNGYVEADGVLKISLYLEKELLKTGKFEVFLTRRDDTFITLTERGLTAVKNGSNLFISEHTNAANKLARGTTVFYSVDLPDDKIWAKKLSKAVSSSLGIPDRGAKTRSLTSNPTEDYYTVIDTAQDGGVPHVILIESAFHDNIEDEKLLLNDIMLRKIAKAQAEVINEWFGAAETNNALPLLKYGSTGNAVEMLQIILNKLGFINTAADGVFGLKTLVAVDNFQKANNLLVDGIVGPITWSAIIRVLKNEQIRILNLR